PRTATRFSTARHQTAVESTAAVDPEPTPRVAVRHRPASAVAIGRPRACTPACQRLLAPRPIASPPVQALELHGRIGADGIDHFIGPGGGNHPPILVSS